MDWWMDGWIYGWMDGWMDGWTDDTRVQRRETDRFVRFVNAENAKKKYMGIFTWKVRKRGWKEMMQRESYSNRKKGRRIAGGWIGNWQDGVMDDKEMDNRKSRPRWDGLIGQRLMQRWIKWKEKAEEINGGQFFYISWIQQCKGRRVKVKRKMAVTRWKQKTCRPWQ